MFVVVKISDVIKISPALFGLPHSKVLTEEIDRKYSNRVIEDVGLCISLYDFESIGDAVIHPSDGSSYTAVVFRMIAFRPFIGEVIVGKLIRGTSEYVRGKLSQTLRDQHTTYMFSIDRILSRYCYSVV